MAISARDVFPNGANVCFDGIFRDPPLLPASHFLRQGRGGRSHEPNEGLLVAAALNSITGLFPRLKKPVWPARFRKAKEGGKRNYFKMGSFSIFLPPPFPPTLGP